MQPHDPYAQPQQYVQTQQYAQPQYTQPQQMVIVNSGGGGSGMAVTSMVMGIMALPFTFIPYANCLAPILVLLGIIFGHIGLSQSNTTGEGRGQAITGLILSYLTLLIWIAGFVLIILIWDDMMYY